MARIGRKHHNNFERRRTNYSYARSEVYNLSGISVSANEPYADSLSFYNLNDLTAQQGKPRVDSENLTFNDNRRPYFEDQYHWTRGPFSISGAALAKYYGSGTLAADEASAYLYGVGQEIDVPNPNNTNGRFGSLQQREIDYPDVEENDAGRLGNTIETIGRNNVYVANVVGGFVDRWNYAPSNALVDADSIMIVHDGPDFGRQNYGDTQILETIGSITDEWTYLLNGNPVPSFTSALGGSLSNLSQEYPVSSLVFEPPLPKSYMNPIPNIGARTYYNHKGVEDASLYYPEYWVQRGRKLAPPYYQKVDRQTSSTTIHACCYPTDFGAELRGGDQLSSAPGIAYIYDRLSYNQYQGYGDYAGYDETLQNQTEMGWLPGEGIMHNAYSRYVKYEIDKFGDGVSRQIYAFYANHDWDAANYSNSIGHYRDTGLPIPAADSSAILAYLKEYTESSWAVARNQQTFNENIGGFVDERITNAYLYSPETKKTVEFNGTSATSATIDVLGTPTTINLEETPASAHDFSGLPEISSPPGRQGTHTLEISFADKNDLSNRSVNFIRIKEESGMGEYPNTSAIDYERYIYPEDPEWLGSNKVMAILERGADNPGGRTTAAVGFYTVLQNDRNTNLTNGSWLAPANWRIRFGNAMTSGLPGNSDFGNAFDYKYTEDGWGTSGSKQTRNVQYAAVGGGADGVPYLPKGWWAKQMIIIAGVDKDDVVQKLENYLANNQHLDYVDARDELPEAVLKFEPQFKGGNIH